MTFKHSKQFDSALMRSLEKVAFQKGMTKSEPITKQASTEPLDLIPSSNLMDNIVKLTAGLRAQGLTKQATEIEQSFFNYKKAQTLYEAHKETGDDVINSAHPKGSHKLVDVDSDEAVVEDQLDKHIKFLKMIEKEPTGKLSNANSIMSAVKMALGIDPLILRKDNISDPRNYFSVKKSLGQGLGADLGAELPPINNSNMSDAENKGIAKGVGETVGAMSTLWAVKKIFMSVGKILGKARGAWRLAGLAEDVKLEELKDETLKQAIKTLEKNAGPKIMQAVEKDVGATVMDASGVGIGTRIMSGVSGLASGVAGLTGATGSGVSLGGLGSALISWPIVAAALVGGTSGGILFGVMNLIDDFKKAGEHVIAEVEDLKKDLNSQEAMYLADFKSAFYTAVPLFSLFNSIKEDQSPNNIANNLPNLKKFNDSIYESRTSAQALWSTAQSKSDLGGQGVTWDAIKGVLSHPIDTFSGWSDVITASANYMQVSEKINNYIDSWITQGKKLAAQHSKEKSTTNVNKNTSLSDLLKQVSLLKDRVNSWKVVENISNSSLALKWIDDETKALDKIILRYKNVNPATADDVLPILQREINTEVNDINIFKNKWVK
jgi:hypothetical protein